MAANEKQEHVGERIARYRRTLGYSQGEIGRPVSRSATWICLLEAGSITATDLQLQEIARAMGLHPDVFLDKPKPIKRRRLEHL